MLSPGLYIVATPIGNLGDLSERALETLRGVSRIYAEDTRHSQKLLNHFDIRVELRSLHQHNELSRAPEIIELTRSGAAVALITDAGTPGISDPGSAVVGAALQAAQAVIPIPGASALAAALSASGFDHGQDGTLWQGFLPQKSKARRDLITRLAGFPGVVVFLESPHRIEACAKDLAEIMGERPLVVCRELTKKYETILRTTCSNFPTQSSDSARGELTLVLGPTPPLPSTEVESRALDALASLLAAGFSAKDASKAASVVFGVSKKTLYAAANAKKV